MSEVFYRIVGDEINVDAVTREDFRNPEVMEGFRNIPKITIHGTTISFTTRTAYLRRDVPDRFELNDVLHIADRLECNYPMVIARKLKDLDGLITEDVWNDWMVFFGNSMTVIWNVGRRFRVHVMRTIHTLNGIHTVRFIKDGETNEVFVGDNGRVLQLTESVPEDETCAICLDTRAETQNQVWATADGCSLHCFHAGCIGKLTQTTCPMCRAPLK
jgi:hypothetical protein